MTAYLEAKNGGDAALLNGEVARLGERLLAGLTISGPPEDVREDLTNRLVWVSAVVTSLAQLVELTVQFSQVFARQAEEKLREIPEELREEVGDQLRAEGMEPRQMLATVFQLAAEHGLTF